MITFIQCKAMKLNIIYLNCIISKICFFIKIEFLKEIFGGFFFSCLGRELTFMVVIVTTLG